MQPIQPVSSPAARLVLGAAVSALLLLARPLQAQTPGPVPSAGVRTTELNVVVRILDGVASTMLFQRLHNDGSRPAEATFLLPLPEGAVADDFRMTVGGVETAGEVLDATRARGVYESIVRARRDPGLLEYYGRGCLRASVFPVPPGRDVVVQATYRELLPVAGELFRWSFPLGAGGVDGRRPERLVLDLDIKTTRALGSVFAPDRNIDVVRKGEHEAAASLELTGGALPDELTLFFGLVGGDLGLSLASTRPGSVAGPADDGNVGRAGFFTLLVAPRLAEDGPPTPRSIVFVLDTSGSMEGAKLAQARSALKGFLASLNPGDRFNVVPFSTAARPFFPAPVEITEELAARALELAGGLRAAGGTNLEDGLVTALESLAPEAGRLPVVVFLTDGLATVGEQKAEAILRRAAARNAAGARVFAFGVGDDVNTRLLDLLAKETGGEREYVRPGEAIEVKTAALFARIGRPALTDVTLTAEGIELFDVVPRRMPDLYRGVPVTVVGRYVGSAVATGPQRLVLRGLAGDERREIAHAAAFAAGPTPGLDFLPALWAERQVGVLLDAIRLGGEDPELLAEVKRLGTEFRIVTPYTSHLIVEEGMGIPTVGGAPGPSDGFFLGSPGGGHYRGPGNSVPPSGGGGGGPSTPGPSGPGSAGPDSAADVAMLARDLQRAGVLPTDADDATLAELTLAITRELRGAAEGLDSLGRAQSGKQAVDDSTYLARLTSGARRDEAKLLDLFSRRIKDKVFFLRAGVWTDRAVDALPADAPRRSVEAWSDGYFALLRERPELGAYLALSDRMVVVANGAIVEVRPAAAAAEGR
jgi:Ca-activated chloride channel family protein